LPGITNNLDLGSEDITLPCGRGSVTDEASFRGARVSKRPTALFVLAILLTASTPVWAQKPSFTVGWSVYVGWNPYYYMAKSGILRKWADKYGINIRVQRFDYAPSLDAFVAKNIDACAMTNMEALDMPAAAGVDTTAIIVGDYSNGNDAVIVRQNLSLAQIPGKQVMLVEKTVSQYLFERAMAINGLASQIRQVHYVNTSDSDIASAFLTNPSKPVVVTWKPLVSQILKAKDVKVLFNSSQIPGEILDLLVVRSEVLNREDGSGQKFAKAITGAWYEVLKLMSTPGPAADKVLATIAEASQDSLESYREQLTTTHMFYTPQGALEMASSPDVKKTMDLVRRFCFQHGLLGEKTKSVDDVAVQFPDGAVLGKAERIRFRFSIAYMQLAAQGKL
jgi:NitT/TauT family transport system substrate-binding protein